MSASIEVTTHVETIARLRNALIGGAWRLRMIIDALDVGARWRDAEEPKTRLLGDCKDAGSLF